MEQLADCAGAVDTVAIAAIELRHARAAIQQQQLERLKAGAHCPLIILPAITNHAVGPDELEQIATLLDSELQLLA